MQDKPNVFIFAGANASGKSTFITHLLQKERIYGTYVNPDLILKHELNLEETAENYKLAFDMAEKKRYDLMKAKENIILETVFSTNEKVDFIQKLKENGYHVTLFFTGTDTPHINAAYLVQRVLSGGHDVPIRKLIDRRLRGFNNIKKATPIVDCLIYVDNSVANEAPRIITSLYAGSRCYTNTNLDRNITWHLDLLDGVVTNTSIDSNIVKIHIEFCETIQGEASSFSESINMSYGDKNELLSST